MIPQRPLPTVTAKIKLLCISEPVRAGVITSTSNILQTVTTIPDDDVLVQAVSQIRKNFNPKTEEKTFILT